MNLVITGLLLASFHSAAQTFPGSYQTHPTPGPYFECVNGEKQGGNDCTVSVRTNRNLKEEAVEAYKTALLNKGYKITTDKKASSYELDLHFQRDLTASLIRCETDPSVSFSRTSDTDFRFPNKREEIENALEDLPKCDLK